MFRADDKVGGYQPLEEDNGDRFDADVIEIGDEEDDVLVMENDDDTSTSLPPPPTLPSFPAPQPAKRKSTGTRRPPKKPKDTTLYRHFLITELDGGGVSYECIHCDFYNKSRLVTFNATKGRLHIVNECPGAGVDEETKQHLLRGSQTGPLRLLMICVTMQCLKHHTKPCRLHMHWAWLT